MAFGKWCMYLCGVLFLLIGVGSLVVALSPSLAERFVENAAGTSDFGIGAAGADTVRTTCWILAATFIPGAFLFFWVGRWFKSVQPSFTSMMQNSAQMMQQANQYYAQMNPQGQPFPGTSAGLSPNPNPAPPSQVVGQWTPPTGGSWPQS